MAAPSKGFTVIPDANFAAGAAGLSDDWVDINANTQHLEEWMGKNYVAAVDHDHDGVNSKKVVTVAAGSIGQTEIETDGVGQSEIAAGAVHAGELSISTTTVGPAASGSAGHYYPANTGKLFSPRFYCSVSSTRLLDARWAWQLSGATIGTSAKAVIYIVSGSSGTPATSFYAVFEYVSASPPNPFGGSPDWHLWLFLLVEKATGECHGISLSEDPIWAGNWSWLPKNHPARIAQMPHPFADHHEGSETWDTHEVQLIDLRSLGETQEIREQQSIHDELINQRLYFKDVAKMTDPQIAEAEALQLVNVEAEGARISMGKDLLIKANADYAAAVLLPDIPFLALSKIKNRIENAKRMACIKSKWQQKEEAAKRAGKTMAQIINAGELPEALATKELPLLERAKLPQVPAFKDVVKVLQA